MDKKESDNVELEEREEILVDDIALGSFDLFYEDGGTQVRFENWDYGKEGVEILLAGTIWVTLSLKQAEALQKGLNELLKN